MLYHVISGSHDEIVTALSQLGLQPITCKRILHCIMRYVFNSVPRGHQLFNELEAICVKFDLLLCIHWNLAFNDVSINHRNGEKVVIRFYHMGLLQPSELPEAQEALTNG